jgi:osmotically inducible protein OsmC
MTQARAAIRARLHPSRKLEREENPALRSRGGTMPTRKANAVWEGGLKGGKGTFHAESGAVGGAYSFGTRFENAKGSNPEELLAAADAACYSMALAAELEKAGTPATKIETEAACTIERVSEGFKITTMKLSVRATVAGVEPAAFQRIAEATKTGCPISSALKGNVDIQLDAKLNAS